ncbi:MAG: energy transducer TonB [Terriglobales bacterium]
MAQAVAVAVLLWVGANQRTAITAPPPYQVTDLLVPVYVAPRPINAPRLKELAPQVKQEAALKPNPAPRLVAPAPEPADAPRVIPQPTTPDFPTATIAVAKSIPIREPVKVGGFSGVPAGTPTVANAPSKVQTGGFGDPNGVPARSDSRGPATIAKLGSFSMPAGLGTGNGAGGLSGSPGRVATGGFGDANGAGAAGHGNGSGTTAGVRQGGFADGTARVQPVSQPSSVPVRETPVEVLSKPDPVYTDEARRLRVEGDVELEVEFSATGVLQVVRVIRGLGHGLDESAVAAARQIRFKPATRNGATIDSKGRLDVVFQLT